MRPNPQLSLTCWFRRLRFCSSDRPEQSTNRFSVCDRVFSVLWLPQSANVASFCQNFEALGYNFGYSRGGLETAKEERRRQTAHDLGGDEQRDINGPNP
jgi:hypothetical protein